MKETGIMMTGNHPRLILDGRKTMTRRVLNPQPDLGLDPFESYSHIKVGNYHPALIDKNGELYPGDEIFGAFTDDGEWGWKSPYGKVGDRLWVRESMEINGYLDLYYKADNAPMLNDQPSDWSYRESEWQGTIPSIHMPRWASRILLEITGVRVERQLGITLEDAIKEGFGDIREFNETFLRLNPHLKGTNPWVWVISFRRIE